MSVTLEILREIQEALYAVEPTWEQEEIVNIFREIVEYATPKESKG